MKYKLIITEEAKNDIASFLRAGDKVGAKMKMLLLFANNLDQLLV